MFAAESTTWQARNTLPQYSNHNYENEISSIEEFPIWKIVVLL